MEVVRGGWSGRDKEREGKGLKKKMVGGEREAGRERERKEAPVERGAGREGRSGGSWGVDS